MVGRPVEGAGGARAAATPLPGRPLASGKLYGPISMLDENIAESGCSAPYRCCKEWAATAAVWKRVRGDGGESGGGPTKNGDSQQAAPKWDCGPLRAGE